MDSDFGKKNDGTPDPTDQRILNWTAIFDEIHDFENNTRGVSGGLGAIVSTTNKRIDLAKTLDNGLNGSVEALGADANTPRAVIDPNNANAPDEKVDRNVTVDWDQVELFSQTIRSLRRATKSDPNAQSVKNGKVLFETAKCQSCHAGPKWTVSRRHYTPTQGRATGSAACTLQSTALAKKGVGNLNTDAVHLTNERPQSPPKVCAADADCGGPGIACNLGPKVCIVGPPRLPCGIRQVGTFGAGVQGQAFEVKSDTNAMGVNLTAQGKAGFNVPSLLSLAATAPYLHHGAAQTLVDLFTDAAFVNHRTAGNANFNPDMNQARDLAAFLLSIDQSTAPYPIDATQDLCAPVIVPNPQAMCSNP